MQIVGKKKPQQIINLLQRRYETRGFQISESTKKKPKSKSTHGLRTKSNPSHFDKDSGL